ncbi:MAG: hypothetical protein JNJ73_12130 [Hyphomonadaceae bacterium]|nr:hypothetical protein [Hyphomonadaceae bacterium]
MRPSGRMIVLVCLGMAASGVLASCDRAERAAPSVECRALEEQVPDIQITEPAVCGEGPTRMEALAGSVIGTTPRGAWVLLYARDSHGVWHVQPYDDARHVTNFANCGWRNQTHLGQEYAALLVKGGFKYDVAVHARVGALPIDDENVIDYAMAQCAE